MDRQKSNISDEDPYSLPGNNSNGGSSSGGSGRSSGHYGQLPLAASKSVPSPGLGNGAHGEKPPKLPPRDFERKQKSKFLGGTSKSKSKNAAAERVAAAAAALASKQEAEQENHYTLNNSRVFGRSSGSFLYRRTHFLFRFQMIHITVDSVHEHQTTTNSAATDSSQLRCSTTVNKRQGPSSNHCPSSQTTETETRATIHSILVKCHREDF